MALLVTRSAAQHLQIQSVNRLIRRLHLLVSAVGLRRKAVRTSAMMVRCAMTTAAEDLQHQNLLQKILVSVIGLRSKAVRTSAMMVRCVMTTAAEDLPHHQLLSVSVIGLRWVARMLTMMALL